MEKNTFDIWYKNKQRKLPPNTFLYSLMAICCVFKKKKRVFLMLVKMHVCLKKKLVADERLCSFSFIKSRRSDPAVWFY